MSGRSIWKTSLASLAPCDWHLAETFARNVGLFGSGAASDNTKCRDIDRFTWSRATSLRERRLTTFLFRGGGKHS